MPKGTKSVKASPKMSQPLIGQIREFRQGEDFQVYEEKFAQYCIANGISEERRVAMLISLMSDDTYKTLRDLCFPEKPHQKPYDELCKLLFEHHHTPINVFRERIKFYNASQLSNESCSEWCARVKSLAADCKFSDVESVLKDKFVSGMMPGRVLDRLVEENHAEKFKKLVEVAVAKEAALK